MLIITSRNVVSPGGELSLIKNRANSLERHWGIHSDVIALSNTTFKSFQGHEAFGSGQYIWKAFSNPFQLLAGYREQLELAKKTLLGTHYDAVLLSGVGVLRNVRKIRKWAGQDCLICADIHGYYGDGYILSNGEPFFLSAFHKMAAFVEEFEQKNYLKYFDRIFTVSSAYKNILASFAQTNLENIYVVPCALGTTRHYSSTDKLQARLHYREKFGVSNAETLLIYSGGASKWQCIPETVKLYEELRNYRRVKLVIFSGDVELAKNQTNNNPDILVTKIDPDHLQDALCAADFCVMLREDLPTNHYAYPNKFLEYASVGCPVIATPHVWDVAQQIKTFGVGIIYTGNVTQLNKEIDSWYCPVENFDSLIETVSFANTLKPFVSDLMKD